MNSNIPLYYNGNHTEFGVLVSPGWGAGFSTWNVHELAYDRRVIKFWLTHKNDHQWMREVEDSSKPSDAYIEANNFIESLGYSNVYWGGFEDCVLEWVPVGSHFRIVEYDGWESLEIEEETDLWW